MGGREEGVGGRLGGEIPSVELKNIKCQFHVFCSVYHFRHASFYINDF